MWHQNSQLEYDGCNLIWGDSTLIREYVAKLRSDGLNINFGKRSGTNEFLNCLFNLAVHHRNGEQLDTKYHRAVVWYRDRLLNATDSWRDNITERGPLRMHRVTRTTTGVIKSIHTHSKCNVFASKFTDNLFGIGCRRMKQWNKHSPTIGIAFQKIPTRAFQDGRMQRIGKVDGINLRGGVDMSIGPTKPRKKLISEDMYHHHVHVCTNENEGSRTNKGAQGGRVSGLSTI